MSKVKMRKINIIHTNMPLNSSVGKYKPGKDQWLIPVEIAQLMEFATRDLAKR